MGSGASRRALKSAEPTRSRYVDIVGGQLMPALAMALPAGATMRGGSQRLQVRRVDAGRGEAAVMQLEARWRRTQHELVSQSVGAPVASANRECAIALGVGSAPPKPAGAESGHVRRSRAVLINALPELRFASSRIVGAMWPTSQRIAVALPARVVRIAQLMAVALALAPIHTTRRWRLLRWLAQRVTPSTPACPVGATPPAALGDPAATIHGAGGTTVGMAYWLACEWLTVLLPPRPMGRAPRACLCGTGASGNRAIGLHEIESTSTDWRYGV